MSRAAPTLERQRQLRRDVERIATRIARSRNVDLSDLLSSKRGREIEVARRAAIRKIVAETGCTATELSWAWGCGFGMVQRALERATPRMRRRRAQPERSSQTPQAGSGLIYDADTVERLRWQHGPKRTQAIIEGRDEATNADLAAWNRLSGRAA